ncbi:acyl-CoA dehydrogenase family protein [Fredinandcohnia onubensis]|uniref:acyl-CoA dehydrogenase family protein n=1 Tax=Fredinandcohnia onubensis TaxID=1571209 RepID=UPI000C0BCE14|nr:acyl-CoA dehydrogenase family protein [Fredinandcohnia onubensis]
MSLLLADEQKLLKTTLRKYCKKSIPIERIREIDSNEEFPEKEMRDLAELGFLGVPFPQKYGGMDGDMKDLVTVMEELSYHAPAVATAYIMCVVFGGKSILSYGNEMQKEKYLPKLIDGSIKFALAVTEPNAGSDIANIKTSAKLNGDKEFIMNGSKVFSTGAHVADYLLVLAKTDSTAAKNKGLTMFLVDKNTPGVEVLKLDKLGMKAVSTNEVFFTDVVVPAENVLGEMGNGFYHLMSTFGDERIAGAAVTVGYAQKVMDDALLYSNQRKQFNKNISEFQVIQHYLAEMQTKINASRLLTNHAAELRDNGELAIKETSMAKYYSSETLTYVANKGMQIFGGNGYMMEFDVQRAWRDSKFWEIAGGTTEIQKNIIFSQL